MSNTNKLDKLLKSIAKQPIGDLVVSYLKAVLDEIRTHPGDCLEKITSVAQILSLAKLPIESGYSGEDILTALITADSRHIARLFCSLEQLAKLGCVIDKYYNHSGSQILYQLTSAEPEYFTQLFTSVDDLIRFSQMSNSQDEAFGWFSLYQLIDKKPEYFSKLFTSGDQLVTVVKSTSRRELIVFQSLLEKQPKYFAALVTLKQFLQIAESIGQDQYVNGMLLLQILLKNQKEHFADLLCSINDVIKFSQAMVRFVSANDLLLVLSTQAKRFAALVTNLEQLIQLADSSGDAVEWLINEMPISQVKTLLLTAESVTELITTMMSYENAHVVLDILESHDAYFIGLFQQTYQVIPLIRAMISKYGYCDVIRQLLDMKSGHLISLFTSSTDVIEFTKIMLGYGYSHGKAVIDIIDNDSEYFSSLFNTLEDYFYFRRLYANTPYIFLYRSDKFISFEKKVMKKIFNTSVEIKEDQLATLKAIYAKSLVDGFDMNLLQNSPGRGALLSAYCERIKCAVMQHRLTSNEIIRVMSNLEGNCGERVLQELYAFLKMNCPASLVSGCLQFFNKENQVELSDLAGVPPEIKSSSKINLALK